VTSGGDSEQRPEQGPPSGGPDPSFGGSPYGQPTYGQPTYGQPTYGQPAYGQPPYGQPAYGQPPYGQPAYVAAPTPVPASTIVLLCISGLLTLSCYLAPIGIAPLVLSVVALTRHKQQPDSARKLTRIGWIVLAVVTAFLIVAAIAFGLWLAAQPPEYSGF
jgi:hypothetical protein